MSLGDIIGEANGQITNIEVVEVREGSPKLKATGRGSGKGMGVGFTDLITYWQVQRAGGELYGEAATVWMTEDGEICTWKGFGVGRPTGVGGAGSYAVCGAFETNSQKLAPLNGVASVVEFETDDNGNYHWIAYEWKHPSW
jgi:hypothetical protein